MEMQTCLSRMNQLGPWEHEENLDTWETDRWGTRDTNKWEWKWKPRTCSFCGCVHPEDALKLIEEKWMAERTDKGYKAYLHPPGYLGGLTETLVNMRAGVDPVEAIKNIGWSPIPPTKLYRWHFTAEQWDKLGA